MHGWYAVHSSIHIKWKTVSHTQTAKSFSDLKIEAINKADRNDTYTIDIESKKVPQLLSVFDGSFKNLAQFLQKVDDKMVLANPNYVSTP